MVRIYYGYGEEDSGEQNFRATDRSLKETNIGPDTVSKL